jgi:hypothetical protein
VVLRKRWVSGTSASQIVLIESIKIKYINVTKYNTSDSFTQRKTELSRYALLYERLKLFPFLKSDVKRPKPLLVTR